MITDILHFVFNVLKSVAEFIVIYVILRHIIARWIANWIENKAREHPIKYRRVEALFQHYIDSAKGLGHENKVLDCEQGKCVVF